MNSGGSCREASGQRVASGYNATDVRSMRRLRLLHDAWAQIETPPDTLRHRNSNTRRLWRQCVIATVHRDKHEEYATLEAALRQRGEGQPISSVLRDACSCIATPVEITRRRIDRSRRLSGQCDDGGHERPPFSASAQSGWSRQAFRAGGRFSSPARGRRHRSLGFCPLLFRASLLQPAGRQENQPGYPWAGWGARSRSRSAIRRTSHQYCA